MESEDINIYSYPLYLQISKSIQVIHKIILTKNNNSCNIYRIITINKRRFCMTKKLFDTHSFTPCCIEAFSKEDRLIIINVSKALGNEARLEIYTFLREYQSCMTSQLVEHLPLAQSTISQHLKVLKNSGVVVGSISGTSTNYCIDQDLMKRYYNLIGKLA